MLDTALLTQVKSIFANLVHDYTLAFQGDPTHSNYAEFVDFLEKFVSTSPKLSLNQNESTGLLEFSIMKNGKATGICFRGIPGGHEFTSLLLALLNADGKGKNLPDETLRQRITSLKGPIHLQTYMSLSCTNCPDVVQALNLIALIHPNISHEVINGENFQDEVNTRRLQGVPAVFAGEKIIHSGRGDLITLLEVLDNHFGSIPNNEAPIERQFDLIVLGGGPAGAASAIYSARKGLKVAIVAERIGGQVKDTTGIENLISIPQTTGMQLAANLAQHVATYPIEVFENRRIKRTELQYDQKKIFVKGGEIFTATSIVIATGASWRRLNVDGESDYIGRGIHFCPHCDGPFYKGKNVCVIGGGNSGVEAAIDLAGICQNVTLVEYNKELRADTVLQEKVRSLNNVKVLTQMQTTTVLGDGTKVTGIRLRNLESKQEEDLAIDGIFVQIGLSPNTEIFTELQLNERKEIVIDSHCRTNIPGVYAAGDVSTVPYKQIIVAMGEGAKAALSAFDDRMRGLV